MQTIYHVKDSEKIDLLLGGSKVTEVKATFGKRFMSLRTRRSGDAEVKFHIRDFDGSEFTLMLSLETGNIDLSRPYMKGSDYEEVLVQQLWRTVSRLLSAGSMFLSDPLPDFCQVESDLELNK